MPIASRDDLTPDQLACLNKVVTCFTEANKLHQQLEPRWSTWYGLARNWRRWSSAYQQANTANDKDVVIDEIKRQYGQELFVPYGFAVIETNVPRILSQTPRYRAIPGELSEEAQSALAPAEAQFEQDDAETHYERKLQETVRSGLRYGLGVQKDHWEKRTRGGKALAKRWLRQGYKVTDTEIVVYEGPQHESVDIFDFFWDPVARDMETARYVIHRTWRDLAYVEKMVNLGKKLRAEGLDHGWLDLDLEAVRKLGSTTNRGEAWSGRYQASGLSGYETASSELFEVWEYHDRDYVYTVLGGMSGILVQEDINPFLHGELPFDIYRPTIVEQEFCGIGEIEPIAHLLWELNTLRGQRRDAATLAINRPMFYQRGTVDPRDVVIGAGVWVPVNMNPSEVLQPAPFVDPPNSGYQEEAAIKADIELASAISESVVGSGGEETATGTQLVQQAANYRIKMKTKNLHVDLLVPGTAKRRALYEQFASEQKGRKVTVEDSTAETGFRHIDIPEGMWAQNFEMVPVDGSTEPDDPIQKKHDATELMQSLIPLMAQINPEAAIKYTLGQHGILDTKAWIKQGPSPGQQLEGVANSFMQAMQEAGFEPQQIEQIVQAAHAHSEQNGPSQAPQDETEAQGPEAPRQEVAQPEPTRPEGAS